MSPRPTQHAQLQVAAYDALNTYFTTHANRTLEIEVLPPALETTDALILEDGVNLGVPKKILALAFVHARHLFFAHYRSDVEEEQRLAHEATRVMLLFDPEHLTAANHRKRHLLRLEACGDDEAFVKAMGAEGCFMNSILTSPLHRQSKSPTLWGHRAWWLDLILPALLAIEYDIPAFFMEELNAAIKGGERHPKNYYAWQYARRVVLKRGDSQPAGSSEWESFLTDCAQKVKSWCMLHVSDISGFSFLMWVLSLTRSSDERGRVVQEMVTYGVNVRLTNESPWTFVRMMLA
ncbi:uncharacterized protein CC84DRAFT_1060184, partial [Paraphaeosphaeria sporulosa]